MPKMEHDTKNSLKLTKRKQNYLRLKLRKFKKQNSFKNIQLPKRLQRPNRMQQK